MEMGKAVIMGIYAGIGLYLLYKMLFSKNSYQEEYEKLYNEIIRSKKYKVKGQYDKEE